MLNLFVLVTRPRVAAALVYRQGASACFVPSSRAGQSFLRSRNKQFLAYQELNSGRRIHLGTARFASTSTDDKEGAGKPRRKPNPKFKKKEITQENIDKLAAAFDELARKEGFGTELSNMAEEATFEDYFDDDEIEDDIDDADLDDLDDALDLANFDLSDFEEGAGELPMTSEENSEVQAVDVDYEDDDDDDFLDFGGADDDMDARIAAATRGQVMVPDELASFAESASEDELRKLGFKRELSPYGDDETPRKDQFKLIKNAMTCSACGSDFQCKNEQKPGFLPAEKFEVQTKLAKIEELQELKEKAESSEWSPEDEIEYLIQTSGGANPHIKDDPLGDMDIDVDSVAEELGLDLAALSKKNVICKRCHGLQNFGKVDESLRPGWTDEPTMSQEKFRELLRPIGEKPAVVIALVDLFDFGGSVLKELDGIAGENPVILCANKVDLLPPKMGKQRAENWVRRELEYMGVKSLANIGGAVCLISSKTGAGVNEMLRKARNLADDRDCDVYVVGAANAGKSTLMNWVIGRETEEDIGKVRAGNRNAFKGALTTSPLPGTTLKFIKVDLGGGRKLYDTPGLLIPGTFTQLLTPQELKIVCPKKRVEPITFRVASGKCVLVGGLARIELIGDCKPFLFTFFVANEVKLHPTDAMKADEFILKHAGGILTPPFQPGAERIADIGPLESHVVDIEGAGWKEAAADITLTGLGWVAVTGAGNAKVKISVPKGIGFTVRPPLMPFDMWEVASRYTGGRSIRKTTKTRSGKRRKGVGRN
eukprot:CAMPEP_0117062108 /NCGR_PEP_ID=MMETSP0472-20121206/43263_1 /TAXON_ID=693140 ORGANISM="Tiarina fusus, Strain LIS" /NCGR_SAMPLE_ID=MMETSP0472 /ASSEMBLY_ACC=CAM_ASM_000603 /LENGTH=768 /DNA_ID=CAMNT_0004781097 /DNA_START=193 /DNA_END=2499 /DNA_ORIENTATION=-